jgi:hypothetical protein
VARYLVTGGVGFISLNIVEGLVELGENAFAQVLDGSMEGPFVGLWSTGIRSTPSQMLNTG